MIEHRATSVALLRRCPSCTDGLTTSTLRRKFSLPPLVFRNFSHWILVGSHRAPRQPSAPAGSQQSHQQALSTRISRLSLSRLSLSRGDQEITTALIMLMCAQLFKIICLFRLTIVRMSYMSTYLCTQAAKAGRRGLLEGRSCRLATGNQAEILKIAWDVRINRDVVLLLDGGQCAR